MFDWFYRRYKGFVKISISGNRIERFLNMVNSRGICIWDISRSQGRTIFYMYVADVWSLKDIVRKTGTKICILERCGLPFFLFSHRKRKMFVAGISTGWVLVYIMSLYVWNISFEGNIRHTDDELIKYMETIGVIEGMKKSNIQPEDIEKSIRNQYFDITWSSVEISGTTLRIHIRENNSQVSTESVQGTEEKVGDIIADKEATIVSIITRSGTPLVKVGDQVSFGDKLVDGKYDILDDSLAVIEERFVKADADIVGRVVYNISETIDRDYTKKTYTGNTTKVRSWTWNNEKYDLILPWMQVDYDKYDMVENCKDLTIGEDFYLPVEMEVSEYREYTISKEKYTDDELEAKANKKIQYILKNLEENTIQIIENNVKIEVSEKYCTISGDITVLEYIGNVGATYE